MGKFCALFLFCVATLLAEPNYSSSEQAQVAKSVDQASSEELVVSDVEAAEHQKSVEEISPKAVPVKPDEPQSFKLMPHKAIYDIQLHPRKKPNDPTVSKVTGQSSIEIIKTKFLQNVNSIDK